MPELRWTLLLIGALFIIALAWWERRKPRQSPRGSHEPTVSDTPAPRVMREPTLTLPEMRAREPAPPHDLPILEIAEDESLIGLRMDGQRVEEEVAREEAAPSSPEPIVPPPVDLESTQRLEAEASVPEAPQAAEPIVDWPPEEERRIIALRLVSMSPERFAGRAIRTALVAEGFVLGRFSIFHKPDAQRRAVLSAASLSKPGVFDLETIDTQRFSGLNLFAILPGPRPPREAFEDLLACARNLNERLQGALQDERGGPLTPTRLAALRDSMGSALAPGSDDGA